MQKMKEEGSKKRRRGEDEEEDDVNKYLGQKKNDNRNGKSFKDAKRR